VDTVTLVSFSFGVVMWEVFHRRLPFEELTTARAIREAVLRGSRPVCETEVCSHRYRLWMERCWSATPEKRPSFETLVQELSAYEERV
jgi:hypothetical protein